MLHVQHLVKHHVFDDRERNFRLIEDAADENPVMLHIEPA